MAEPFERAADFANALLQVFHGFALILQGFVRPVAAKGLGSTAHGLNHRVHAADVAKLPNARTVHDITGIIGKALLFIGARAGAVGVGRVVAFVHDVLLAAGQIAHAIKHFAQRRGDVHAAFAGGDLHVFDKLAQSVNQLAGIITCACAHQGINLINDPRKILLFEGGICLWLIVRGGCCFAG